MVKCNYCGKEFEPSAYQKSQIKKGNVVYCSKSCVTSARYDKGVIIDTKFIDNIRNMVETTNMTMDEIQIASGLTESKFKKLVEDNNIKRSKEHINKIRAESLKNTNLEKYGVENVMDLAEFRNKIIDTKVERYGSASYNNKEKQKQTCLEKYGDENYNNREKAFSTNIKKYGAKTNWEREDVIEKRKQTSLKRYGVENPLSSKEVHDLARAKMLEKYGSEYSFNVPELREKAYKTMREKYGNDNAMRAKELKDKMVGTMLEKYGVTSGFLTDNAINSHKCGTISKINKEFAQLLRDRLNVDVKLEKSVIKYIYDLQVENLLIDINPTISHNSFISYPYRIGVVDHNKPVSEDYHYKRYLNATENGYHLISVFDWDNWDKVCYLINQNKETLYARKLHIREVSTKDTSEFLNSYHIQNTCKGQTVRLGLYMDDELIELMTFGKPRYNKNYEWELLRLCTKPNYIVVGGAEKLFNCFVSSYEPNSIISYCDLSKFTGGVYKRLGFTQNNKISPSKHWSKGSEHITDNLLRQRGYDQLFNANYGKGTSNEELMILNGWLPVYDCGQASYTWTNSKG